MNWFQVLMEWLQMQSNNLIIGITRGMAQSLWYVEKLIAFLSDQITTSTIWRDAMAQMVTVLSADLPPVLRNILFGAGGGLWGVLSNLAFIRQYGALHLGEISGLNTSLTVFASAIGPVLFSVAQEQLGTFTSAAIGCLAGLVALLIVSVLVRQPRDIAPV